MENQHLWLYIGIILLIAEIVTPGFFVSILSVGALVASLAAYFDYSLKSQLIAFLLANIIAFIYVRPLLIKLLYKGQSMEKTNIDKYIGKECIVTDNINNTKNSGRVKVNGESWIARSVSDDEISVNEYVKIEHRKGTTFYVSKINKEEN